MSRGYRPSSDLQVTFSAYHGTFNVCLQNLLNCTFVKIWLLWQQFRSPYFPTIESRNSCWTRASKSLFLSLRIRRFEVMVQERTEHARSRYMRGERELLFPSCVSFACLVLSCAHYFQAPATQAIYFLFWLIPCNFIGKFIIWRGNSTLNCTRKPISHGPWSDECDVGFQVQFNVEFTSQVMDFPWIA